MARNVTIQDISRAAGTSPSTVSRVLNGSAPVSKETRAAVEEAIRRLNYRPSHLARSLKTNITFSVGLLLNDITNPFYSAVARGVEEEANRHGYSLILCNTNEDPERELQYLEVLQDKHVDGIILGPTEPNADYIRDLARQTPIVQVDRQLDNPGIAAVVVDNEEGAYRATRLLIQKGHRKIAVVRWQKRIVTIAQRYAGYERALCEAGISLDPDLVVDVPSLTATETAVVAQQLLRRELRPTAIFALNNQIGLGVLGAVQQLGLRIPADIALIVFDDLDCFALITPSITAIRQPAVAIGECAVQLLTKQIDESPDFTPGVTVLRTELIVRESV